MIFYSLSLAFFLFVIYSVLRSERHRDTGGGGARGCARRSVRVAYSTYLGVVGGLWVLVSLFGFLVEAGCYGGYPISVLVALRNCLVLVPSYCVLVLRSADPYFRKLVLRLFVRNRENLLSHSSVLENLEDQETARKIISVCLSLQLMLESPLRE